MLFSLLLLLLLLSLFLSLFIADAITDALGIDASMPVSATDVLSSLEKQAGINSAAHAES